MTPRRIALLTYVYPPSVGGIETVSRVLAEGLRARGHEVQVITHTPLANPGTENAEAPSAVLRQPDRKQLLAALRRADVVLQSHLALEMAWPLALGLVRRPWVVVLHTPLGQPGGELTWKDRLKLRLLPRHSYAVSSYLRDQTSARLGLIHNPIDTPLFFEPPPQQSPTDLRRPLLFVGRLTRAKGPEVLIEAMGLLKSRGLQPGLTVVGDGDQKDALVARVAQLGLDEQVHFAGVQRGAALGDAMRAHQIIVMPSLPFPPEALGLVAVEAMACGCIAVASRQGGLAEAVGAAGLLVEPGSAEQLADALQRLLADEALQRQLDGARRTHLAPFRLEAVLDEYEAAMARALG